MNDDSDLSRLSRIGDSVFAVVVTLLAYRVRLPQPDVLAHPSFEALSPFLADLGSVVLSFVVATMFWMGHWGAFRRLHRVDVRFVALHFAFLGALVLLPISTSLMSAGYSHRTSAFAYSLNVFLLALALLAIRAHARRLAPEAFGSVPVLLLPTLLAAIFGAAMVVSLVAPGYARLLWTAAFVCAPIERRWGMGRLWREQRLPAPPPRDQGR
jgi:uncharacterized membrane protein